jgi:hypothetical protein
MEFERCPHCNADLRGEPIPEKYLREGSYGAWDGVTPRYYWRTISVEIQGAYDGGLYYLCPDCGFAWHRWPVGHVLHERAKWYVTQNNQSRLEAED